MREFGYKFKDVREMTQEQIEFLVTGLEIEAREQRAAERRQKLTRRH